MTSSRLCFRSTPIGLIAICWLLDNNRPTIGNILLPRPGQSVKKAADKIYHGSTVCSCPRIEAFADDLEAFLNGKNIRFTLDMLWLKQCTAFQRKVLRATFRIPAGRVSSYKAIATKVGKPRAARAVGMVMAFNPFPLTIPCHRVISADGSLGGFQSGPAMKRALLEREGIVIEDDGTINRAEYFHY